MSIHFRCPYCRTPLAINEQSAGSAIGCGGCGQQLIVPDPQAPSDDLPVLEPVVVYIPPGRKVADYRPERPVERWEVPREERVYVREEVHFVHEERGTFGSAFGRTMGEGCGCIVLAVIALGMLSVLLRL
jgi:hypothetical protein